MNTARIRLPLDEARRLEELALNASGASRSLLYDGWLLGYSKGPSKRLRCVNAFHRSTLPLPGKVEHCVAFYRRAALPALFRMLPFSQPAELDAHLDRVGFAHFEPTLVQLVEIGDLRRPALPAIAVEIVDAPRWVEATAKLFAVDPGEVPAMRRRVASYPLPQAGALARIDGEVVAGGLVKMESGAAGIFTLATLPALRGQGIGRAVVTALLEQARRYEAARAYLQVTAANAAAVALYARFGFRTAYNYWYRALPDSP
jgi:ribosomal protein S18 acetylase RimI-like enzyme